MNKREDGINKEGNYLIEELPSVYEEYNAQTHSTIWLAIGWPRVFSKQESKANKHLRVSSTSNWKAVGKG